MKHQHIPQPQFRVQHRLMLTLYLPNMDRDNNLVHTHARWCAAAEQHLQHRFDVSVRCQPEFVRWLNSETALIITEESTTVCANVHPCEFRSARSMIEQFMWRFGVETSQRTVMYRYGNNDYECEVICVKQVTAFEKLAQISNAPAIKSADRNLQQWRSTR